MAPPAARLPPSSEVKVLTVVYTRVLLSTDPFLLGYAVHYDAFEEAKNAAPQIAEKAAAVIRESLPDLPVTTEVRE